MSATDAGLREGLDSNHTLLRTSDGTLELRCLSLKPYPGRIIVCPTPEDIAAQYVKYTGNPYPHVDPVGGGRWVKIITPEGDVLWLIFAVKIDALAHELCHVLFFTFREIGAEPDCGNGEPFCYMLSKLLCDAALEA